MGATAYDITLSLDDYIRVRIETARGLGVVDFTVQYEAIIDGTLYPVVRYDCAHGQAHRDTLDARGRNVEKLWLSQSLSYDDALQHALEDIRARWPQYREGFLRRMA